MNIGESETKGLLPIVSNEQWENAANELSKHLQDFGNDRSIFNDALGCSYAGHHYIKMSLKRVIIKQCIFSECEFNMCASTGSTFNETVFKDCNFIDSNFQFCDFLGSSFNNEKTRDTDGSNSNIIGVNMSSCNFNSTKFVKVRMTSSTFTDSSFKDAEIESCKIDSCTFQGATFENTLFRNMDIDNINIEYADFYSTIFKDTTIPLMQIHYTLGGLEYFFEKDGLHLRSSNPNNISKKITKNEYIELLPSLEVYFKKMGEYFPLANIYLAIKDYDKFKETVKFGIQIAIHNKKNRDILFIVKLARKSKIISTEELKKIYYEIIELVFSSSQDKGFINGFIGIINEIKYLLLDAQEVNKSLALRFILVKKNSKLLEGECINGIISELEQFSKHFVSSVKWNRILISRNTPLDFTITYDISNINDTFQFILALSGLFLASASLTLKIEKLLTKHKRRKAEETESKFINKSRSNITKFGTIKNVSITNNYNIYINSGKEVKRLITRIFPED